VDPMRLIRGRSVSPRSWPIWELPGWVASFIVVVVLADATVLAFAACTMSVHVRDLELFAGLLACIAATVELTRRVGEKNAGVVKDVYAVWELPVAILLPLGFAPVLPGIRFALAQWRIRRVPVYRRVFSAAAIGLSYVAAGVVFRFLIHQVPGAAANPVSHALAWMPIVAVCAVVQWIVNQTLVLPAIKGSDPTFSLRDEQFAWEPIRNDLNELCVAVLVTFCLAASWVALVFAFPFISLLQRSLRHAQLLNDSRADSKTGLLNAATWEAEAGAEVTRAVRTRSPLAVALLDLDRFKQINDTHGHLAGDEVLKEIARTLRAVLREYDLAGRFGGEEFALLLPQTRSTDAFRIAERVRGSIAGLTIIAPGAAGEPMQVTVSIGVAALDVGNERTLAELLAAADAALYRAKALGRDQVQMISTARGLSATSGMTRGINGAAAVRPKPGAAAPQGALTGLPPAEPWMRPRGLSAGRQPASAPNAAKSSR
jgi:diguanylate cyclase (GGDEF)-like protein